MQIRETVKNDIKLNAASLRFEIPMTARGRIHGVYVKQKAGTLAGFTFRLFSKRSACPITYPATDPNPQTPPDSPENYLVIDPLTAAALAAQVVYRDNQGMPYCNWDNDLVNTRERDDNLFGQIDVVTPDNTKSFDLRIVFAESDA